VADPDPPPFLSRKHLPSRLAKLRELEGMTPVLIRGQGTEIRLRCAQYVIATTSDPSTGAPPPGVLTWWCGRGGPSATAGSYRARQPGRTSAGRVGVDPTASDPGGWPRLDWSMDAALLIAALAARAGDHIDFIAHDRVTRAGVYNASRNELLAHVGGGDGAPATRAGGIRRPRDGGRRATPDPGNGPSWSF